MGDRPSPHRVTASDPVLVPDANRRSGRPADSVDGLCAGPDANRRDQGRVGTDEAGGTGLLGVRRRVTALDGTAVVTSPREGRPPRSWNFPVRVDDPAAFLAHP